MSFTGRRQIAYDKKLTRAHIACRIAASLRRQDMATWKPDPTFYPSARMSSSAPKETVAYVASFDPTRATPDDIEVVDVDPASAEYGRIVNRGTMPNTVDEVHHLVCNV